jgi:NAD(P)-dependent dehydrogenase (short-subunit alcohol dehydrogenase family)
VTEKEVSIQAKIKTAIAVWGRIDVLVNNAGFGRSAFIEEGGYVHSYSTSRAILMTNGDIGQS